MRHPSSFQLSRFADDALSGQVKRNVGRHIEECDTCRSTVDSFEAISATARTLPRSAPPAGLWTKIDTGRRRTATAADRAKHLLRPLLGLAAAVTLILFVSLSFLFSEPAVADNSELQLSTWRPLPHETISAVYRPTSKFSADQSLRVRAEVAFPDSAFTIHLELGGLTRDGEVFRGDFMLPPGASFAALALASEDGSRLDLDTRNWLLVLADSVGRPTLSGLSRKAIFQQLWATDLTLETRRSATRLHPDSVAAWSALLQTEEFLAPSPERESIRTRHREMLREFDRELSALPPNARQNAAMVFYARNLADSLEAKWFDRMIKEYPEEPATSQIRVMEIRGRIKDSTAQLAAFEELFAREGDPHGQLSLSAFNVAQQMGDSEALQRWAPRLEQAIPRARTMVAVALAEHPQTAASAMRRLPALIQSQSALPLTARDFNLTRSEMEFQQRANIGRLELAAATALLNVGNRKAALHYLRRASDSTWRTATHETAARTALSAGDSTAARAYLARVLVDPGAVGERWSLEQFGVSEDSEGWARQLAEARAERDLATRRLISSRSARSDLTVRDSGGLSSRVRLPHDDLTVVGIWSRYCTPSVMQLGRWGEVAARLEERRVRVLSLSAEEPNDEADAFFRGRTGGLTTLFDPDHTATAALDNTRVPRYYVLDSDGRIRFESSEVDDLVRVADYLSSR